MHLFLLVSLLLPSNVDYTPTEGFSAVLAALPGSGFHQNTSTPKPGYTITDKCPFGRLPKAKYDVCTGLLGAWKASIVSDKKVEGQTAVQEVWLIAYTYPEEVRKAVAAFDDMLLHKHPYLVWHTDTDRFVYLVEGRFRFPTPMKALARFVDPILQKAHPGIVRPKRL